MMVKIRLSYKEALMYGTSHINQHLNKSPIPQSKEQYNHILNHSGVRYVYTRFIPLNNLLTVNVLLNPIILKHILRDTSHFVLMMLLLIKRRY